MSLCKSRHVFSRLYTKGQKFFSGGDNFQSDQTSISECKVHFHQVLKSQTN